MIRRRESGGLPEIVAPMLPSGGSGQPPIGSDWVVELAWTGHRCIAYVEPGQRTRLRSANNVSMTAAYPELAEPLERRSPRRGMVLDGTLVARGEEHAPRARLLKRRSARFHPSAGQIRAVPVDFQVADLLWLDGHNTMELPYRDRRSLLEGLGFDDAPVWSTSPLPMSELATVLQIADAKGVDALHARHLGGRYRPGGRSPLWVRVPVPRVRAVVVGGWTATNNRRPDVIASLLLGVPEQDGLRYVGRVGVARDQRHQVSRLRTLRQESSPFDEVLPPEIDRDAHWVRPQLVGLVEFTGWGAGGRLRLPHWRGAVEPIVPEEVDPKQWARPGSEPPAEQLAGHPDPAPVTVPEPAPELAVEPMAVAPEPPPPSSAPVPQLAESVPDPAPSAAPAVVEDRRLEQHFFYNALNTIASLIRTDPARARDLLFGFADLSRATDQPIGASSALADEMTAVRAYLQLEQARFGKRLRVEVAVDDGLMDVPVHASAVLSAVREAVQQRIEPTPNGGDLRLRAARTAEGAVVTITVDGADPVVVTLPVDGRTPIVHPATPGN